MEAATKHTFAYKQTTEGQDIELDLYLPSSAFEGKSLPVLVHFHGGGVTSGNRERNAWFPEWIADAVISAGFAVVCAEYTLLVPKDGHQLVADIKDLFRWIDTDLNTKIQGVSIDSTKITVAGTSAGGYVAYLSAIHASPKPRALVPIFAMGGNYLSDQYIVPKTEPFFLEVPLFPSGAYFQSIFDLPPTAHVTRTATLDPMKDPRIAFYPFLLQEALFLDHLTSTTGLSAKLAALPYEERAAALPTSSLSLFPQLANGKEFPPMFLLHGTADTAVKIAESRAMKLKLDEAGVECELYEKEGATHGFDNAPWDEKEELTVKVLDFLKRHVA